MTFVKEVQLLTSLALIAIVLSPLGLSTAHSDEASGSEEREAPELSPAPDTIYINRLTPAPVVDGTWGAGEWSRASVLDIYMGAGQCLMYIGFEPSGHRLFIGLDVLSDVTADTLQTEPELALICIDGEDDGEITYTNPTGLPEDVVLPLTYGGPCKDRWAQIFGWNTNYAGWINIDGTTGYPTMWRDTYGYEHTDQMRAGFSSHRFYEYSIDYQRSLGLSAGKDSLFGLNLLIRDGYGDGNPGTQTWRGYLPWNYSSIAGPWAHVALAQMPRAVITSPVEGQRVFLDEEVEFDASGTTYDTTKTLTYSWDFGDGERGSGKVASHGYAAPGVYNVTLEVTDSEGLSNSTRTWVDVRERNAAPELLSFSPASDPIAHEGETVVFKASVDDSNLDVGDELRANWSVNRTLKKSLSLRGEGPHELELSLSTSYEGELSAGRYTVELSIQDSYLGGSELPTRHSWNLTVENTNRAPKIISALPDLEELEMQEGTERTFSIERLDPDGDRTTALWYVDDLEMGAFRDSDEFTYRADFNSSGQHIVRVEVTDRGLGRDERSWRVRVLNVNRPPRIDFWSPREETLEALEGEEVLFTLASTDPDGEQLAVQWLVNEAPAPGSSGTGFALLTAYEGWGSSELSPYLVKAVVRDPGGLSVFRSWEVVVTDVNRPPVPVISEPAEGSALALGSTVRFRAEGSWDPDSIDNGSLAFSWDFGDGKSGAGPQVSHKYSRAGSYRATLRLRDRFISSYASVNVTITAPVLWVKEIRFDPPARVREGQEVNVTVRVFNNGDAPASGVTLKLFKDGLPLAGLSVETVGVGETADATYKWTAERGNHTFRAIVDPREGIVVPDGSPSERTLLVRARPPVESAGFPAALVGGGAAIALVSAAVAWVALRGRSVLPRRGPGRAQAPGGSAGTATAQGPPSPETPSLNQAQAAPPPPLPSPPEKAAAPASAPHPPVSPPQGERGRCPRCGGESPSPGILCRGCIEREAEELERAEGAVAPAPAPAPPAAPKSTCGACGEPLEEGWRACPACGAELAGAPIKSSPTCPTCSEPLEEGWRACPACGTLLNHSS
ncbi:MAG: PKD domain-containing protein [Thermoplasmatota archaeon]